jgi:hypothetical protein
MSAREFWLHMAAFCVAAAVGAILVHPLYPLFEAQTETASEAFGAYLTCIVIAGGVGPGLTLPLFWLWRRLRVRQPTNFDNSQNIG